MVYAYAYRLQSSPKQSPRPCVACPACRVLTFRVPSAIVAV